MLRIINDKPPPRRRAQYDVLRNDLKAQGQVGLIPQGVGGPVVG